MKKQEAFKILNDRLVKDIERENDEMVELIQKYLTKLNEFTDEQFESQFKQNLTFNEIRTFLEMNTPKTNRKPAKRTKQTYYKLMQIDKVTEKAYGIVTGTNGQNGSNYREYYEYVPFSQVIEKEKEIYVPSWIVVKNSLWNFINKNESITEPVK
jgi:hypothetical protein